MRKLPSLLTLLCLSVIAVPGVALAAGSSNDYSARPKMPADYLNAVKAIKTGDYQLAIPLLKSAEKNRPQNADIQNLLGFTNRKLNLKKAGAYYRKALQLDKTKVH